MSIVYLPVVSESASTGGFVSSDFRFSIASFSDMVRERNVVDWFFSRFLYKGAANPEKLGRTRQKTLRRPKNDLSSTCVVESLS